MKKIITLIKTSKTLFKFLVYLYYFYRRIYKFFTETNERKEYYTQIEEIKRNKKIIVDISFCGIGDLLVWSLIPELLKKQYNVNFYISKKTFDLIKNKDVFDLIFGLNPYFKGVCDDGVFFRLNFFIGEMSFLQFFTDKGGVSNIEMIENQFGLRGLGVPKLYYKPKFIYKYKNVVLIDKNMISGENFGWKFYDNSFEKEALKRSGCNIFEYVNTEKQDLFTYIDMIYSCKYFVCTFSGSASIAACLKKQYSVIWPYNAVNGTNYQFRYLNSLATYVK